MYITTTCASCLSHHVVYSMYMHIHPVQHVHYIMYMYIQSYILGNIHYYNTCIGVLHWWSGGGNGNMYRNSCTMHHYTHQCFNFCGMPCVCFITSCHINNMYNIMVCFLMIFMICSQPSHNMK